MSEKPLHVQVAEALGWTRTHYPDGHGFSVVGHGCEDIMLPDPERLRWRGRAPDEIIIGADCTYIPRYDTDWSATGPLIEKYGIALDNEPDEQVQFLWRARKGYWEQDEASIRFGQTPLIAVCNLILALRAAGKLES